MEVLHRFISGSAAQSSLGPLLPPIYRHRRHPSPTAVVARTPLACDITSIQPANRLLLLLFPHVYPPAIISPIIYIYTVKFCAQPNYLKRGRIVRNIPP